MTQISNKIYTFWGFIKKLYGGYAWEGTVLIALGFFGGLFEGLGIGVLVPLFSYIVDGKILGSSTIERVFLQFLSFFHLDAKLRTLLGLIVLLFLLKALALLAFEYLKIQIITNYEKNTRSRLYHKALHLNWFYLLKQKIGHLENMLMVDIGTTTKLLDRLAHSALDLTSMLIYIAVALSISPSTTAITLVIGGAIFLISQPLLEKTKAYAHERVSANKLLAHQINESVLGIKTIKAAAAEDKIAEAVKSFFERFNAIRAKLMFIQAIPGVFTQPVQVIFIASIFVISFLSKNFSLAGFLVVIYIIQRIFVYIDRLQSGLYDIADSYPSAQRIVAFQKACEYNREEQGGNRHFKFSDKLEFKKINFAYAAKPVLTEINFYIKKGEMVGLVGLSGAGKTTIADLLLRLFKPTSGEILLDGVNCAEINVGEWRKNLGYVAQDVFLKNDTIAQNIKFYENISEEKIARAAQMANIYEFVMSLPRKFETMVGERGVMLSAGQRQRIILARALARDPQILVLDEATSALDNESESLIKKTLDILKGKTTILIIAHRLSSVMDADRIIALEEGKILEEGAPAELMKNEKSYFYKMRKLTA